MRIDEFVSSVIEQLRPFGVNEIAFKLTSGPWGDDDKWEKLSAMIGHGDNQITFSVTCSDKDPKE